MADIDNKKPEQAPKPKPDDSTAHALTVFAQSLAYTAVEAPTRGVAQVADHIFGTKLDEGVQAKLANAGVHQPEAAAYGTKAWTAEQFGSGLGMVVPMWLARKAMVGKAEQAFVKTVSAEGSFAAGLKQTSLAESALHEAKLSGKTGFLYGAFLTPTDDKNSSGNFLVDRLKQGFNSAATFGAMGYSSSLTSGVLGRAAQSLESTSLPTVFKSPLQTALHSSLIHGAIGGVPGGIIQAQLGAMESGKPIASLQDVKESVVSMTMVGGAMGSAGLFKETPRTTAAKTNFDFSHPLARPLVDNLAALRLDSVSHATSMEPITAKTQAETAEVAKVASPFDIKFDAIKKAWPIEEVNQHMTVETRGIDFIPEDLNSRMGKEDWKKFSEWGIDKRDVPVNVYRFPGMSTEIVVPSDYARILDQVREQRLNPTGDDAIHKYQNRILPEELAQVLSQMPDPDVVRSVELHNQSGSEDALKTHESIEQARRRGAFYPPGWKFVSGADANSTLGRIRFFDTATNDETELRSVTAHEWSHIAENDPAYKGFGAAQHVERSGFFSRPYALENTHENWAVHLGERFLNSDGSAFAELPEKAPARTLIMAKAVLNMLEQRQHNPTPKHEEFRARVEAAGDLATRRLQEGILADIADGNLGGVGEKLRFLNVAATSARSPEIFEKVLRPIDVDLLAVLDARVGSDDLINEVLANRSTYQLAENYSAEKMSDFTKSWKQIENVDTQILLFKNLPEAGQRNLLDDLTKVPWRPTQDFLSKLADEPDFKELALHTVATAQENFDKQALTFYRANKLIPRDYRDWMSLSENPELQLAVFKNKAFLHRDHTFSKFIDGFESARLQGVIADDAMAYVAPHFKSSVWNAVLEKLPQSEQVKLFRELGHKHDAAYLNLADRIEKMNATEFGANSEQIHDDSLKILLQRENNVDFITANPNRIKDLSSFQDITKSLDGKQIGDMLRNGSLEYANYWVIDDVIKDLDKRFDARNQLDILAGVKLSLLSESRLDALFNFAKADDPFVAAKAEQLLIEVAGAQLKTLSRVTDQCKNLDDFLMNVDDARARRISLEASYSYNFSKFDLDHVLAATKGLSEPQLIQLLKTGLLEHLSESDKVQFLNADFWNQSANVKNLQRSMIRSDSKITGIVLDSLPLEPAKPAHPFDIKFDRVDVAWAPEEVNKYMTVETRPIGFAPEGRESRIGHEDWSDFENWGVETRDISVNVYRFPGVQTEIVVPSDYAQILDQVREKRLNYYDPDSNAEPADGISVVPHNKRILPEEIAQLLKQLPHPDLVSSVELLDHADPWDVKNTYDEQIEAREKGEEPPERDFVALADADLQGLGRMRFYNSSSHHPEQMHATTNHEWAHLVQRNKAYEAFDAAEDVEKDGYYSRDYARKNAPENWAVHLGEEFLGRDGADFAALPEKAPARTLVMAKALRNMLEQRKDNPSPKHQEFLARVDEAENVATRRLQDSIRADIAKGDDKALDDKLYFLNIAASRAKSSDTLQRVLAPLDAELLPYLEARGFGDSDANEIIANRLEARLAENNSPDLMPEFSRRWRGVTDSTAQMELFHRLPHEARQALLGDLATNPVEDTRSLLDRLIKDNSGRDKKLFKSILEIAQTNFEGEGLALYHSGQVIPKPYVQWMEKSENSEARLAVLKNRDSLASKYNFYDLTQELEPRALRQFIVGDAMAYVDRDSKNAVWNGILQRLPQEEQVKLFRELGREHDPAYRKIATRINKMGATEYDAESDNIRKDSLRILLNRENSPEYIITHPDRIRDARSFNEITDKLSKESTVALINAGALDRLSGDDIDTIVERTSERFDPAAQVELLGAIKPERESLARIDKLTSLSMDDDPEIAAKAQSLLLDVANEQLMFLQAKQERDDGYYAYQCYAALEKFLATTDSARARLMYVNAGLSNPHGSSVSDSIDLASYDLSEPEMLAYLRSGIVDLLNQSEKTKFLRYVAIGASPEVNAQLKSMGLKPLRQRRRAKQTS